MNEQVIDAGNLDAVLQKEDAELAKAKKPAKNAVKAGKIKGLSLENVIVMYRDEMGRVTKDKVSLIVPYVKEGLIQTAARKALSLYFDDTGVLPQIVMSVRVPKDGIKEIEIDSSFLEKPIGKLTKKECVWGAIYYNFRTVVSALNAGEDEMRTSLSRHYENMGVEDMTQWKNPIDLTKTLKELK